MVLGPKRDISRPQSMLLPEIMLLPTLLTKCGVGRGRGRGEGGRGEGVEDVECTNLNY